MANRSETFTFEALPADLAALQALPEAALDSPFKTTALTLLALCAFEKNEAAAVEMLNFLKGPDDLSNFEKQFIKERLSGKYYKVPSFFAGATPENGYEPARPYSVTVLETPYSYPEENWATMYVQSSGADAPRSIRLRKKPSTGQWFLWEQFLLADVRVPVGQDPWA